MNYLSRQVMMHLAVWMVRPPALSRFRSLHQGCQMAKFDPFLSLNFAEVEGRGSGVLSKGKEGIKFCSVSLQIHSPSSPKGQTPTI